MNTLLRTRSRLMSVPRGVRQMSGHSIEEAIAETDKWKKISFGARPSPQRENN